VFIISNFNVEFLILKGQVLAYALSFGEKNIIFLIASFIIVITPFVIAIF